MTDPDRYLSVAALRDELPFRPRAFDKSDSATNGEQSEWEAFLERLIGVESERIEGDDYAATRFVETETSTTLYGDEDAVGDDLVLSNRPVQSVEEIVADGETLEVGTDVRVRKTHVTLLDAAPMWDWPDGPIEISYTWGHDSVPGPVQEGIVRLVRSRLEKIQSDGLESESMPTGQSASYRPPREIRGAVQSAMRKYRPDSYYDGATVI